jgi:hypothetical protein
MKHLIAILAFMSSFFATGCASNQSGPDQGNFSGGTVENQQESSLGGRASRINLQIGPPECTVR